MPGIMNMATDLGDCPIYVDFFTRENIGGLYPADSLEY
jgi:hypothetical protein